MMRQKKGTVAMDAMNKSDHGLLKALLITFSIINIIGIVWYSNTLNTSILLCGVISFVSAFVLGVANLEPTKTAVLNSVMLRVFAMAGIGASGVRILYDTDMLRDLWGAIPHLLTLILFGTALKVIRRGR